MSTTTQIRGRHTRVKKFPESGYHVIRVDVDMDILVDWNALADLMSRKLARNKSGRSMIHGGIIKATRRKVTETDLG